MPARALSDDAKCAAKYASHAGVLSALTGLRAHWSAVSSAVHAGEVAVELSPDVVEMGTDADPVRRLLLTKAMLSVPAATL